MVGGYKKIEDSEVIDACRTWLPKNALTLLTDFGNADFKARLERRAPVPTSV